MQTTAATSETIDCSICHADDARILVETPDLMHPGSEQFRMVCCDRCGHIYQNPRPTPAAIGHYYPSDYHAFEQAIADEPGLLRRIERTYGMARRRRLVEQAVPQRGRLLDIGCATGIFLNEMHRHGWEAQGVERSHRAATYARERFGLTVYEGRIEDIRLPERTFDVVTMWDVLEHVHDPRQVLQTIARLLKPAGLLVCSLPNPDSLEARLLKAAWVGYDLPRHLNLFRIHQLARIFDAHELDVEQIRSPIYGYSVLVMSLLQQTRTTGRRHRLRNSLLRTLPLRLLAGFYYRGPASWYNLSSTMVIWARRRSD
jgi:2-polyprenyl-3-methyl-5-hydroxy-6-metoxy-1,4-benzoquinol methylase